MPAHQVAFAVEAAQADTLEAVLEAAGAEAITWAEAPGSTAVLEPPPGETRLWDQLRVEALFPADCDCAAIRAAVAEALGAEPPDWHATEIADQPWERAWLEHFQPQCFGGSLWVVPWGMDAPEPDAVNIRLDPGLAFGTGTHPSTALCLAALAADPPLGETVIDYGCGSGLLAIAALRLGAARVLAVDNDPQALVASRDNAERNGVADRLEVADAEVVLPVADRVLANILAGILQDLAPRLTPALASGGRLTLAGLLAGQADSVRAAYEPACQFAAPVASGEWVRLDGRRAPL